MSRLFVATVVAAFAVAAVSALRTEERMAAEVREAAAA